MNPAPRLLIPASGVGTYYVVRTGLETGEWDRAALYGAVAFALLLFGPALFRAAMKAAATHAATKRRKAAAAEAAVKATR